MDSASTEVMIGPAPKPRARRVAISRVRAATAPYIVRSDGVARRGKVFVPDENVRAIHRRKRLRIGFVPMLPDAALQVIGHASVEHGVSLICHHINPEIFAEIRVPSLRSG